jgi:hypothetical protein
VLADFLTALSVLMLVLVLSGTIGCWLLWRRVLRANQVVPDRRSPAPLSWLWSWNRPARLHRRLRRACQIVPVSIPVADLVGMGDALNLRAAQIDERLVAASRMAPPWRNNLLRELGAAVSDVESSACHLERVAVAWRDEVHAAGAWEPFPPLNIRSRLGAVEAALADVGQASGAAAARAGGYPAPRRY